MRTVSRSCDHCNAPLELASNARFVICRYCGAQLEIDRDEGGRTREIDRHSAERHDVPMPERFTVEDLGNEITIRWRWFHMKAVFLVFFCVAWDSFLFFWYSMAIRMDAGWIFIIFPLAHVAVGVGLTWFCLTMFVNSTTVRVRHGYLTVRHGPLPMPGNRRISTGDIEQLYCTDRIQRGKSGSTTLYTLHAQLIDGRNVKLLANIDEADQVLYLEQKIEKVLGIDDRRVGGEMAVT